jgi:insulysin
VAEVSIPGETDAKNIRLLTKQDMQEFFNTYIHHASPTRKKLSVHLTSQKAPIKFSISASEALLEILKEEGVPVEEDPYRQLSAAEPPLDAVLQFWTKQLKNHPSAASILARIRDISSQYPAVGAAEEPKLPDTITRIDDIAAFKARMTASNAPTPVGS